MAGGNPGSFGVLRTENEATLELARALARTSAREPARRNRLLRLLRAQLDATGAAVEETIVPLVEAHPDGHADVAVARALRARAGGLLAELEVMDEGDERFAVIAGRLHGLLRWIATHDRLALGALAVRRLSPAEMLALAEHLRRRQRELAARRREDLGLPPGLV